MTAFATLLIALIGLIAPKVNYLLFSTVVDSGSVSLLLSVMALLVGATISSKFISVFHSLVMAKIETKIKLADHLMHGLDVRHGHGHAGQSQKCAGLYVNLTKVFAHVAYDEQKTYAVQDIFWNKEQLGRQLGVVDAITIVNAIKEISINQKSAVE